MSKASIFRNGMALVSMTAVPLAFCTSFAEARGVGVGFQSPVQDARTVGRATNAPKASPEMASQTVGRATNTSPTASPEMASLAGGGIVAESAMVQVQGE